MGLEKRIGQMIIAGFPSKMYDRHLHELIEKNLIANIILFCRNIGSKTEVADLNRSIQESMLQNTGIPAFIAIDQEGGMVTRLRRGVTFFPGNMAFAAAGINGSTFTEGKIAGKELKAIGINMNLAPVLDINNNPLNPVIGVRSYGDSEKKVAEYGTGYIKGIQKQGVIAAAKHFPGHGDTDLDSHLALPSVPHSMERLLKTELYPFKKAIRCGVDAVMSAHVLFPAIEQQKLPATLSYNVLTGLLRERLRFNGLIITDCMEMNAIAANFGTVNAAVMAVKAGADLLCISHSLDLQIKSLNAIREAVLCGDIPESRIDASVKRILDIKRKYGLFDNSYPDDDRGMDIVGCKNHLDFAGSVSRRSITLIKAAENLLPVKTGNLLAVSPAAVGMTGADDDIDGKKPFCRAVEDRLGGSSTVIPLNPDRAAVKEILDRAKTADTVIVGTYNANLNEGQANAVNEMLKVNKNIIVVSLRNPYDILMFREVPVYICAYEYTPLSVNSVIRILDGTEKAVGRLPVRLTPD